MDWKTYVKDNKHSQTLVVPIHSTVVQYEVIDPNS
jgi:hypothetical protein